ncbi:unnamed protein product [Fraxinus pennsylvanica]|uniref:Uncharacterized protein n=1 Tax=Fraxinus pennsylvanica TaxID=56036 RepID=A0AAD2A1M2_9LAMI|nr:unnamed protein product [Fraxinus pennsylvanica]
MLLRTLSSLQSLHSEEWRRSGTEKLSVKSGETSKTACKTFTNSHAMSLFLLLLFFVPLYARRINSPALLEVSLASQGRVVLSSHRSKHSTAKFNGGATTSPPKSTAPTPPGRGGGTKMARSTNREFQAAAHEVPRGPNPIGNG